MENYEIVTAIGKGSAGIVYLAKCFKSKKMVAIKKVEIDDSRRSRSKKYVVREAAILRRLDHPHIVACEEYFLDKEEKSIHIVLEYCGGGTMQDIVKSARVRKIHYPEEKILRWMAQITSAVAYMHARRILHRDLKTENVFLIKPDKTKLGDFGISKEIDHTLDLAQTCVGTPCYLSPELCQDIPYNSKSDIWALGCLLFEITALKPAFDAANLISLFYKIVKGEYAPLPDHISKEIIALVALILQKDPELRPTASKLLQHPALVRFSDEPGISVKSTAVSLPKISPARQTSRISPEEDRRRPPMLAAIRHRKVDSIENEELQDTITNDTFTGTVTEAPVMQFSKASENLNGRTQTASQSLPPIAQRRRELTEIPINKAVEPLVLNGLPTEAESESARPQSCPHSVSREVTENYEEDQSFTDTVVTWSGEGDRGSRHPSGRNNRRVSLSSGSEGSLSDSDIDQANRNKNSTQKFNDYSTSGSSLERDSDSDSIYEELDDTATSNPTGDEEIPEEIVTWEDGAEYNSVRPKKGVVRGSGDKARLLPGSAWLRDKKIQVMDTNTIVHCNGNKNDNNNNNKNSKSKKMKKARLPGSSWPPRKKRLSEDRNHQESSSDEVVVLGEANENVQRRTKLKSKRKSDRSRDLPGSAWLKNTKINLENKSVERRKFQETRNDKESADESKIKIREKSIILESCSSSANEYYDSKNDQMYASNKDNGDECYEYEDDFEISDDDAEDEVSESKSSLDVVKQGCIDMLGEKTFEDLTLLFMRGLSLKEAANKFKSKNVNYETLETCFLLSSKR